MVDGSQSPPATAWELDSFPGWLGLIANKFAAAVRKFNVCRQKTSPDGFLTSVKDRAGPSERKFSAQALSRRRCPALNCNYRSRLFQGRKPNENLSQGVPAQELQPGSSSQ